LDENSATKFHELFVTKFLQTFAKVNEQNFDDFHKILVTKFQRNLAKFWEIKFTFALISYLAKKKIEFGDHPSMKY
jgi:hypothetical protein